MEVNWTPEIVSHLLDSIHDGILIADKDSIVRYVNAAYTRITGVSRERILGQPLRAVRPGAKLPDVIKSGQYMLGVLREENGVEYVVDMFPIMQDGQVIGGISIVFDITQVRQLTRELVRSELLMEGLKNRLSEVHRAKAGFKDIVGHDAGLEKVVAVAARAAQGEAPVLIMGETGTGKSLLAEAIHNASRRANGPFVVVNCAAVPGPLLESELFGYTEGSFTGAKRGGKVGLFQTADGGTIFLDEIGELSLELQAKLLRVIEAKKVRPIGSNEECRLDVRVISATNRNLEQAIKNGAFRGDLFYRLNVIQINIPPLRERPEDIPRLVSSILGKLSAKWQHSFEVTPETIESLRRYHWPGNVRELENALEYAAHFAGKGPIRPEHLPDAVRASGTESLVQLEACARQRHGRSKPLNQAIIDAERQAIQRAIAKYGTSVEGKKAAARELGISLATLYNRLREYRTRENHSF
ncbi:MAG TPA: sigma 54-interacting transcriptional regulator [Firmicutes bacterium]|nr:sigma 54-interacting transcriptional regulator [Bacillota bacterium]